MKVTDFYVGCCCLNDIKGAWNDTSLLRWKLRELSVLQSVWHSLFGVFARETEEKCFARQEGGIH